MRVAAYIVQYLMKPFCLASWKKTRSKTTFLEEIMTRDIELTNLAWRYWQGMHWSPSCSNLASLNRWTISGSTNRLNPKTKNKYTNTVQYSQPSQIKEKLQIKQFTNVNCTRKESSKIFSFKVTVGPNIFCSSNEPS